MKAYQVVTFASTMAQRVYDISHKNAEEEFLNLIEHIDNQGLNMKKVDLFMMRAQASGLYFEMLNKAISSAAEIELKERHYDGILALESNRIGVGVDS
jgi:hypothetical protein